MRAVCNLSVCRRINRQYKHNPSCTVHNHQRLYIRILYVGILPRVAKYLLHMSQSLTSLQTDTVHRYFTESCKIFTAHVIITIRVLCRCSSQLLTDSLTDCANSGGSFKNYSVKFKIY
jgi:hypothetical protein